MRADLAARDRVHLHHGCGFDERQGLNVSGGIEAALQKICPFLELCLKSSSSAREFPLSPRSDIPWSVEQTCNYDNYEDKIAGDPSVQ